MTPSFESLIAPCSPDRFFSEHWRFRPLHVRPSFPARFESLLRVKEIDSLFSAASANQHDWFFFRGRESVARGTFVDAQGQVLLNSVYALYRDGGTIHLRNTQRYVPAIETLWRSIAQRLHTQVRVNLWVTSTNAFKPFLHYDSHDIFVLQLHGRKHWTLYDHNPALFAPRATNFRVDRRDVGEPAHSIIIEPGETLYVPAGTPHEVTTSDPHSAHLAVGVFPILWRDVLDTVLSDLDQRGSALAEAVPLELLSAKDGSALRLALRSRLLQATDEVNQEMMLAQLETRFVDAVPPPLDTHFASEILGAAEVRGDDLLRRRADAPAVVQSDPRGETVTIRFPGGGAMRAPASLAETLHAIASAPTPFSAEGLPGDFDLASRKLLLEELLQRGLLERAR